MPLTNKHGLSRTIPASVKRLIRQKSKFGCVICRCAIYTYEHIDPVFVEAKEHDPEKMCLLCPNHQRDSTDGVLSKSDIVAAYKSIQDNHKAEDPRRSGFFDLSGAPTEIQIGDSSFTGFESLINVNGENYLSLKKNAGKNGYEINGKFLDNLGNELFRIENNEWIGNVRSWDIDITGSELRIRKSKGEILFSVKKDLSSNKLHIQHLDMWASPFHIKIEKGILLVGQHDFVNKRYVYYGIDGKFIGGKCALFLDSKKHKQLSMGAYKAVGGEGTYITGTGICIGRKSARMLLYKVEVFSSENCPVWKNGAPGGT